MNEQFITDAISTESVVETFKVNKELLISALNAFVAAGTILDQLKRQAYYGTNFDQVILDSAYNDLEVEVATYEGLSRNGYVSIGSLDRNSFEQDPRIIHGLIGCMTEAAELGEAMLTYIETGTFDAVNIQEEMFDTLWYQAILHNVLNIKFEQTCAKGIAKLQNRKDKITGKAGVERNLDAERAILEGNDPSDDLDSLTLIL